MAKHGSPEDRGSADAWYRRRYNPHYFLGATYNSLEVTKENMTEQEIADYDRGYYDQTDHKDWR